MKYILILLTTMLFSCDLYEGADIVRKVENYEDNNGLWHYTTKRGIEFYARPYLYTIGDTVWFSKK